MMALNVPLEMMRLGKVRGTLAELAELVAAVDLPVTVGAYIVDTLQAPDAEGGDEDTAVDELQEVVSAFADDPATAMQRFFGSTESSAPTGTSSGRLSTARKAQRRPKRRSRRTPIPNRSSILSRPSFPTRPCGSGYSHTSAPT
jgi:hypothetical protein